jgi:hypothetical protein
LPFPSICPAQDRSGTLHAEGLSRFPHFEIDDDGMPKMKVIVPEWLRQQAADTLTRAMAMLKDEGRGR